MKKTILLLALAVMPWSVLADSSGTDEADCRARTKKVESEYYICVQYYGLSTCFEEVLKTKPEALCKPWRTLCETACDNAKLDKATCDATCL